MSKKHLNQQSPNRYWKVEVQKQIQQFILDTFQSSKQKIIDRIAIEHKDKTNSVAGFRFRGESFVHSLQSLQPYQVRRLHASLVDDFQAHHDEWERHNYRQHEVNAYINQVLNKCKNSSDLHLLLPSCVHQAIPEKLDIEPTLKPDQVAAFQEENAEGVKLLKMQLILNTMKA